VARRAAAVEVARWRTPDELRLDHASVGEADLEWMSEVRHLTLWDVELPARFLAALTKLVTLDLRGGSARDLDSVRGCQPLQLLCVNQVRGLTDLGALVELRALRALKLYGLPQVRELPSLRALMTLERVDLGSMKGLDSLAGLLEAPALRELMLSRAVALSAEDIERLASHPTLSAFRWIWEDVPARVAQPVVERLSNLPHPSELTAADWLAARSA
jgi:hypothetical protein